LDIIKSWPAEEQQRAHAAIEEIEDQALKDMQVCVKDLCCWEGGGGAAAAGSNPQLCIGIGIHLGTGWQLG
jgi:hypothetical protein